jgi:hypothetical protein
LRRNQVFQWTYDMSGNSSTDQLQSWSQYSN